MAIEHTNDHGHDDHGHDDHDHDHDHDHAHTHGVVDPSLFSSQRGIWAVKWSFVGLFITCLFQVVVFLKSGSVALLADTIHNLGDALTAIPLWFAFRLSTLKPTKRFTYGYGRVEDLAGVAVVLTILGSAIAAGYSSIVRLLHPQPISHLTAVMAAAIVGFVGNEAVAWFRIKVGKEIGSAALTADGHHARLDGLASLAVLVGAVGVRLGFPLADPIVGLLMTALIFRIVFESGQAVFTRLLDGVDPEIVDEIKAGSAEAAGVLDVSDVRVRWSGHKLYAEVNIAVSGKVTVEEGHAVALEVRHKLLHRLSYLSNATVHVDSAERSGEKYHQLDPHTHDKWPMHSH